MIVSGWWAESLTGFILVFASELPYNSLCIFLAGHDEFVIRRIAMFPAIRILVEWKNIATEKGVNKRRR
jgi:hypothetical protein